MPTIDWLKNEFAYGYDSGDVLALKADEIRAKEEKAIGGSYLTVARKGLAEYLKPDSKVMELGPGRGSWSRAILKQIPHGELHTFDFQDLSEWLRPELYDGRLVCHKVSDNSFSEAPDDFFDFFWSFGVLCHNNQEHLFEILKNSLHKMKKGGIAVHQYSDWEKLEAYGWHRGTIPVDFKYKPDEEIWWPRNNQSIMTSIATAAGWKVVKPDLGLVQRDSIILMIRHR